MTRIRHEEESPSVIRLNLSVVQIVLVILKLSGVIKWRWLWVLAPVWGYTILCLLSFVIVTIVTLRRKR